MIVITTPTGNIGHQVLANLLESGASLRVIVRDASRLPAETRNRVEIVEGSQDDLRVVTKGFEGADAVFWLAPGTPSAVSAEAAYVDFSRAACEAFKTQRIKRVVSISALGRGWPRDAGHVSASLAMDDMIASTGVGFRALTCPSLMENLLRQLEPIKQQGMFFSPMPGDLKVPTCATRDVAAAASELLLDPSWTGAESLAVLGPEDLSFNEMAQIMSEVLGKPIRYQTLPMDALRERLTSRGMSNGMAQAMVNMMTAKNEGLDNMEPRTPQSTSPTSFRQWCEEVLKPAVRG